MVAIPSDITKGWRGVSDTSRQRQRAGIFMNSAGLPEIYPIPEIVDANGSATVLYGTNDLNGEWKKITSSADRAKFHFFKIVIE